MASAGQTHPIRQRPPILPPPRPRPPPLRPGRQSRPRRKPGPAQLHTRRSAHDPAPGPTQERVPLHAPLRAAAQPGDFGDLVEDLFGFDSGTADQAGVPLRAVPRHPAGGAWPPTTAPSSSLLQRQIVGQDADFRCTIDAIAATEGTDNFTDSYSPALRISCRRYNDAAVYSEPIWVNDGNANPSELVDDDSSFMLGLGTRVRLTIPVYGVFEQRHSWAGSTVEAPSSRWVEARRPQLPAQFRQRVRDHVRPDGPRRLRRVGTIGFNLSAEVLLTSRRGPWPACSNEVMNMRGTWMAAVAIGAVLATAAALAAAAARRTAPSDGGGTGGGGDGQTARLARTNKRTSRLAATAR